MPEIEEKLEELRSLMEDPGYSIQEYRRRYYELYDIAGPDDLELLHTDLERQKRKIRVN